MWGRTARHAGQLFVPTGGIPRVARYLIPILQLQHVVEHPPRVVIRIGTEDDILMLLVEQIRLHAARDSGALERLADLTVYRGAGRDGDEFVEHKNFRRQESGDRSQNLTSAPGMRDRSAPAHRRPSQTPARV